MNLSSSIFPPRTITAAAAWRERLLSACQDAPTAAATLAPATTAPSTSCDFKDKSTIHGIAPTRANTSATNRVSLPLVFSVANMATQFRCTQEDLTKRLIGTEPRGGSIRGISDLTIGAGDCNEWFE
jgi:hypothetical protein